MFLKALSLKLLAMPCCLLFKDVHFFPGKIVVTKDSTCEMVHQTLTIITTALLLNLPPYHVRKTYFLPICNQIELEKNV